MKLKVAGAAVVAVVALLVAGASWAQGTSAQGMGDFSVIHNNASLPTQPGVDDAHARKAATDKIGTLAPPITAVVIQRSAWVTGIHAVKGPAGSVNYSTTPPVDGYVMTFTGQSGSGKPVEGIVVVKGDGTVRAISASGPK